MFSAVQFPWFSGFSAPLPEVVPESHRIPLSDFKIHCSKFLSLFSLENISSLLDTDLPLIGQVPSSSPTTIYLFHYMLKNSIYNLHIIIVVISNHHVDLSFILSGFLLTDIMFFIGAYSLKGASLWIICNIVH